METTVYIWGLNGLPLTDWAALALIGFKQRGSNIKFYEHIDEVPLNRYVILVGPIEDTREWFRRMDIEIPKSMTMPEELIYYSGRAISLMSYEKAMAINQYPYFVKPYDNLKQFTAGVVTKASDKVLLPLGEEIDPESQVLVSEVIDIISEWRGYVIKGKLVGIYNYAGDFLEIPNRDIILEAIKAYKSQPAAYSIDFGIRKEHHQTVLIECNDFWSLGNYGLRPRLYTEGIITRWREILAYR